MSKSVSSGLLKATLAKALNRPEREIDYSHRVVQEGGEVSRGKRGKGGAGVTPRDAAVTIIAVASSYMRKEMIDVARGFNKLKLAHSAHIEFTQDPLQPDGNLRSEHGWSNAVDHWQCKGFQLDHLQRLSARHTFADALTAVIEAARDKAFEHANTADGSHNIEVVFWGPEPTAMISLTFRSGRGKDAKTYQEEATYLPPRRTHSINDDNQAAAFEIRIKIDWQPIYAVAKLFRQDG